MIIIEGTRLQKVWFFKKCLAVGIILLFNGFVYTPVVNADDTDDDLIFIHHSVGQNWLSHSLHAALLAKDYIDERNDIYYGTVVSPDNGRPGSLGSVPGDETNMNHWILWFNDYFEGVKNHGCADGFNKIIMFKSCFPISDIVADGTEPGDPFSSTQTIVNYKAVYRHPSGSGNTYSYGGYTYYPLEDVFAANPDILFIPVTAPPLHQTTSTDPNAHRARVFNDWLTNTWLSDYNNENPDLNNVAPYYWFDLLAYPDNHPDHPNRLKSEYGGESGNSHPNTLANQESTVDFATGSNNFIDTKWNAFINNPPCAPSSPSPSDGSTDVDINADLSWYCSDPDGDDLTYNVYFDENDPTPDELVSNNQSENWYDPGTMEYNTHYYWQIVAWDNYGESTSGPIWDFITGSEPNDPPYLPSDPDPENGSTNIGIGADLSWIGGDPDPEDTVVYDVYLKANDPTPDNQVADDISETTFDPGTLEYATMYYWLVIAKDNHGASTPGPVWHFTTEPVPDLDCSGSLEWTNVELGETVEGSFTVENIGEPSSLLDWEVAEYPEWGTWTFTPSSGDGLKPEDGPYTVGVTVIAPDKKDSEFSGEVKIVNKEKTSDNCTISVYLQTPKNNPFNFNLNLLGWLFERFPHAFSILRNLLRLYT